MSKHTCLGCGEAKEIKAENFRLNKTEPSGFALSRCKDCMKQYDRDRGKRVRLKGMGDPIVDYAPPHFGSFEEVALRERFATMGEKPISIYREILKEREREGD
jgi:hypothetical protein